MLLSHVSRVRLCATPQTAAHQAPVAGILQATILEWVAMPSPRASPRPRDPTCITSSSCISRQVLYLKCHLGSSQRSQPKDSNLVSFSKKTFIGVWGFPSGSVVKNPPTNTGNMGLIPGSGRSPGNPLQYSCLKNSMDRGAWRATVHGTAKIWTH